MNLQLKGKKALVVGGYSELGTAIAAELYKENVEVWQQVFPEDENLTLSAIRYIKVDIRIPEKMRELKKEIVYKSGKVDILINIPKCFSSRSIASIEPEEWEKWMEYGLDVPFLSCKEMIPHMVQHGGGTIVNVSSAAAITGEISPAYAAACSALNSMTRGLSREFKEKKVTISGIAPAISLNNDEKTEDIKRAAAAMAVLLCSRHGTSFAGETILIDGGKSIE